MGASYIFFNSDKQLSNGLEIEIDKMHTLGKADDIKNLINDNFDDISWEQDKNHGQVTWFGRNSCLSNEYVDVSIDANEQGNCNYVFFNKSSDKALKKVLSILKTNNVFIDGEVQIINNL